MNKEIKKERKKYMYTINTDTRKRINEKQTFLLSFT